MTVWFTSDHHFGHRNIIRYSNRPYLHPSTGEPDPDAMNLHLVEQHNSVVGVDDEVWMLGDVALGPIEESLQFVRALNGKKTLVVGNHDRNFRGSETKRRTWDDKYVHEAGFEQIIHGGIVLYLADGTPALLNHFPYVGDSQDVERHSNHRPADTGGWLIHGHVHEKWRQRGRQINVGVDAWAGTPVDENTIVNLIRAGKNHSAPLPWKQ